MGCFDKCRVELYELVAMRAHLVQGIDIMIGVANPAFQHIQATGHFDHFLVFFGDPVPGLYIDRALLYRAGLVHAGHDDVLGDLVKTRWQIH